MNFTVLTYVLYTITTVSITMWVARTLRTNGQVFLNDIFKGESELAKSVNQLLVVGFYLVNIGYAIYTMRVLGVVDNVELMLMRLSSRVGFIILVLGGMHFFNLFVLFQLRKKAKQEAYHLD